MKKTTAVFKTLSLPALTVTPVVIANTDNTNIDDVKTFELPPNNQSDEKQNLNNLYGNNVNVGSFSQKPNAEAILSGVKVTETDFHNESLI
jgi:hypothetical protein